jgi:glycosyltransferase involved in cell wall biosynthesis
LDDVQVIYTNQIDSSKFLREDIKKFRVGEIIKGIWNRTMLRVDRNWYARIAYTYRILERGLVIPGHFDCAISYSTDYSDLSIVLEADADKRVAFVHGDATQGKRAARMNDHLVRKMDKIYCVSERSKELFLAVHPDCAKAMDVLYNIILPDDIIAKSLESAEEMIDDGNPILCTVGRLSEEKGQQMIPEVAELLRDAGLNFKWYLVGDGRLRPELKREISARNLMSQVFLLGAKQNPYPYMKNCNIYVQTSFSEAYCITVAEARILAKPIISTDAPGIREQITNGENGLIVDAMTPEALAKGIKTLLDHPEMVKKFKEALSAESYTSSNELQKLYDFIES